MKISTAALIQDLVTKTQNHLNAAQQFRELTVADLNNRHHDASWSMLECIEHLNLYGDFYLPEIEEKMNASTINGDPDFKSGLLGNYFANAVGHKEKLNKMKTFQDKNPINSKLDKKAIDRFIQQQYKTLDLLSKAQHKNLNKIKTGISISNFIKLKLGDTFRVVIYHNERHIEQVKRCIKDFHIVYPS